MNRLIRFFRYSLKTPLLQAIPPGHQCFRNAKWTNENDEVVGKAGGVLVVERVPGIHGELGVRKLSPDTSDSLQQFLKLPTGPPLSEEILSDAQSAWFEGNLRRAVLELAIACEVIAKRRFFTHDSPAGAAFDYLEDKARVSIRVPELLDRVSMEAFGKSFRTDHPSKYRDIDHLFRCRNKVAHRGELMYRDDGGKKISVDSETVSRWLDSVVFLKDWLHATRVQ